MGRQIPFCHCGEPKPRAKRRESEAIHFLEIASGLRPSQRQKDASLRAEGVAISHNSSALSSRLLRRKAPRNDNPLSLRAEGVAISYNSSTLPYGIASGLRPSQRRMRNHHPRNDQNIRDLERSDLWIIRLKHVLGARHNYSRGMVPLSW